MKGIFYEGSKKEKRRAIEVNTRVRSKNERGNYLGGALKNDAWKCAVENGQPEVNKG